MKVVEFENKDVKVSIIFILFFIVFKNVCGIVESRKLSIRDVFWCGFLLLIIDMGSFVFLVVIY